MIAPFLASSLGNLYEPENKCLLKKIQDQNSIRMNNFFKNTSIPVTLYSNMLTFRNTNNSFILNGSLLKTMKIYNFNVAYSNPKDKKKLSIWRRNET